MHSLVRDPIKASSVIWLRKQIVSTLANLMIAKLSALGIYFIPLNVRDMTIGSLSLYQETSTTEALTLYFPLQSFGLKLW